MAWTEPLRSGMRPGAPRRRSRLRQVVGQVAYQQRTLVRSPVGAFFTFVLPLLMLFAVTLLNSDRTLRTRGGIDFPQFFAPAMVAFAVLDACYTSVITGTTLARDEGILKRLRGTPLPPWVYMAGRVGAAALVAIVSAVVVIAVAAGAYDIVVPWRAVPSAALTLVVGAFCFCALALAITVLIPTADTAFPVAWGTALPLAFISDVFLPLDSGPDWLKSIADVFPVRHLADALEYAFNPVTGGARPQWVDLGVMLAWGLAATAVALRWFRWEPHAGGPATGRRLRLPRRRGGRERG